MRAIRIALLAGALTIGSTGLAEAGWEQGVAAFKAGDFTTAAREFQDVVDQQPEWPGGHYMLGQALGKLNRGQDALTHLRKAYDLNPNDAQYQLALAKSYIDMKRYGDAASLLNKVNESGLAKSQQSVYNQLKAVALSKSGQADQAVDALRKVAQANPNDAAAQYNYGSAAFNAGQISEAIRALEKAVQLDSRDPEKRVSLITALIRSGRMTSGSQKKGVYQKAASTAQALVSQQPTFDNYLLLGEAHLGAGQYDQAVGAFNQAAGKKSNDWTAHFYIGQARTAQGRFDEAEAALKKALASNPSSQNRSRIQKQLAYVYEKQKKFDLAEQTYAAAGDPASAARVKENAEIAKYNQEVAQEEAKYRELKEKEEELKKQLENLPGNAPPR